VLVDTGKITGAIGKKVFATMFETGRSAAEIVAAKASRSVGDDAIEKARAKSSRKIPTASPSSNPATRRLQVFRCSNEGTRARRIPKRSTT